MLERFALWAYGVLMHALTPWVKLRLRRKGLREPGYLERIQERFGFYPTPPSEGHVWIHAVSLGESRAAAILIQRLKKAFPNLHFLLTHGTATGREEGLKSLGPGDLQVWQPWDTPQAVDRFLKHFRPQLGVLIETEVWPHLVHQCRSHQVPVVLVNARMSQKSFQKAKRWSLLSKPAFNALHFALAQHEQDAKHLSDLSCRVQQVVGNIKFDAHLNPEQLQWGQHWRSTRSRAMVLLASSREGEESLFLDAVAALTQDQQHQFIWAVVPRHPQRFEEVASLIESRGFELQKRTQVQTLSEVSGLGANPRRERPLFFLGNSLGEMNFYYSSADIALLGGSYLPFGGQNLIEAIASGCPVLVGPHTFNFKDVAQEACQCGAAVRVENFSSALEQVLRLLGERTLLEGMKISGAQFLVSHQGATERTVKALEPLIKN